MRFLDAFLSSCLNELAPEVMGDLLAGEWKRPYLVTAKSVRRGCRGKGTELGISTSGP